MSLYSSFTLIYTIKVDSVRRVVKRIKLEVATLKTSLVNDDEGQDGEPDLPAPKSVLPRSPHTRHMSVRELNASCPCPHLSWNTLPGQV